MLFSGQMAAKTRIRPDEYLRMTFEHDAEFVHGELVERAMADEIHSAIQFFILLRFGALIHSHALYPRAELRMRVAPDAYRIPDVAVFAGPHPPPVPDKPPLVVVEIVSQDDRHLDLMRKLEDYRQWGVANIWVVNPVTQGFSVYTEYGLQNVSSLSLRDYPLELTPAELFSSL